MKQVGLIGYPVAHSLSPQMLQAAFDVLGVDAHYALWETRPDRLTERIASLRSPDVLGANVTIPYKRDIVPLVDACDPLADRIGAINTIVHERGRLVGYNTDAPGFIRALVEFAAFDCRGKKVVILGTGGAARAAAVGLLEKEVEELILLGRTEEHLDGLLDYLRTLTTMTHVNGAPLKSPEINRFLYAADLVVNATPVGLMADDARLLVNINLLPTKSLVMDMIFNPPLTPLLRAALARGCRVLNGLSMLLYQGALAFEIWVGRPAPLQVMRRALGLVKES